MFSNRARLDPIIWVFPAYDELNSIHPFRQGGRRGTNKQRIEHRAASLFLGLQAPLLLLLNLFLRQREDLLHLVPPLFPLLPLQASLHVNKNSAICTSTFADFSVFVLEYHSRSMCSPSGQGNTESSYFSLLCYTPLPSRRWGDLEPGRGVGKLCNPPQ